MRKITGLFIVLLVSILVSSCSNSDETVGNLPDITIEKTADVKENGSYSKEEYDLVVKERDRYKTELENEKMNLKQEKDNAAKIQSEYNQYREKMKVFENLSEAEAEARLIEANRIKAEEEQAKKKAEEEAERLQEEKRKQGYDTGITYEQLARTPDNYMFEKVKFSGKVVQTLEGDGEVDMRLAVDDDYDKMIYVVYDSSGSSSRILEKDEVIIYGVSCNLYSYTSTLGATITIPLIIADKVELKDGISIVSDSGENVMITPKDYITQHGDEIIKELNIKEYKYSDSWGWYYYDCFEIENPTDYDINIQVNVKFYDKDNKLIGVDSEEKGYVERGTTVFLTCNNDEKYDHSEYEITVSPMSTWRSPATSKVSYEVSETSKKIIISAHNNSDNKIDASADILFFNNKGQLIGTDHVYFNNMDAGSTLIKEGSNNSDAKNYRIIFYATE